MVLKACELLHSLHLFFHMLRKIKNHPKLSCLVISDDFEKKLEGQKICKIRSGIKYLLISTRLLKKSRPVLIFLTNIELQGTKDSLFTRVHIERRIILTPPIFLIV